MFDIILLNTIFILFPILFYLIYIVYENTIGKKGSDLFFGFAIFTSMYFISKYSIYFNFKSDIIKILLLICIIKNKKYLSILIAVYISVFFGLENGYSIVLLGLEYTIQLILLLKFFKSSSKEIKISIFLLIEIMCGISFHYNTYGVVIFSNIFYAFLIYLLIIIINKIEKVIDVYGTIREVEYEKSFRESLFKVTHEIKNPIAVCKGYLDMLDLNNAKQVNKYVPIIKEEINRTLTLMNDFLNLTKLKVDKDIIDIMLLLDDLTDLIEALLLGRNIHLLFSSIEEEIYVYADYDRLKQVFINLVKNSMESIDDNKIGILKLDVKKNKRNVVITLEDNGLGMNKETLNKIGESFFTTKQKGTGLGIKLSKEIIELHNGTIKFTSKENVGTKVTIELPIYTEEN